MHGGLSLAGSHHGFEAMQSCCLHWVGKFPRGIRGEWGECDREASGGIRIKGNFPFSHPAVVL